MISGFSRRTRRGKVPTSTVSTPSNFEATLSFVRENHDAHPIALSRRRKRCKSLFCNSETENDLREGIIMNYAPYLGAIRGEHVRAAARSIGAALIEQPGLEALFSVAEENSEMG